MTRNVVLVVLDTVRKDFFDEYAPRLREASTHSFEECRSASSWSVPSHTSIFTGQLPHQHGVHSESFDASFDFAETLDRQDTFLADLPEHRTVGLSANAYINSLFGFDALFDEFHDFSIGSHTNESLFPDGLTVQDYMAETDEESAAKRYLGFLQSCLGHEKPGKSLANGVWSQVGHTFKQLPLPEFVDDGASAISDQLQASVTEDDEPVFAFVNYMDAHTPLRNLVQYDDSLHSVPNTWSSTALSKWELNRENAATAEYADNYRQLYGAAIDYLDRTVTDLTERLDAATDHETTVIVTADHGHNLGFPEDDDGLFHHTGSQSEGLLHVPFEIINPPEGWAGVETERLSQLQVGEIVRRLADEEPFDESLVGDPAAAETVGLLGTDDGTWGLDFSEAEYAHWSRMIRTVYDGDRKYEWDSQGAALEYDLESGRPCWQELAATDVDVPQAARNCFDVSLEEYKRQAAGHSQDMDFDDEVEDRLQTLGYL